MSTRHRLRLGLVATIDKTLVRCEAEWEITAVQARRS